MQPFCYLHLSFLHSIANCASMHDLSWLLVLHLYAIASYPTHPYAIFLFGSVLYSALSYGSVHLEIIISLKIKAKRQRYVILLSPAKWRRFSQLSWTIHYARSIKFMALKQFDIRISPVESFPKLLILMSTYTSCAPNLNTLAALRLLAGLFQQGHFTLLKRVIPVVLWLQKLYYRNGWVWT